MFYLTKKDHRSKTGILTIILFYGTLLLTFLIYSKGITGIFLFDDIHNLETLNTYGGVTNYESLKHFVFSNTSGPTGRPVSMLSFLINDQYWPGSAMSYKTTNILLHIFCGALVFYLIYSFSKICNLPEKNSQYIGLSGMGLWLLHPLNVSTTLYVIQRMTILMSIFSLLAIIFYLHLRKIDIGHQWKKATSLTICILFFSMLSVLSKENGVLLLLYILVIDFTILNNSSKSNFHKYWHLIFIILPLIIICVYFILTWDTTYEKFSNRNFTVFERLLTESRILVLYLAQIVFPRTSGTGLFHDDIDISTGLFSPLTTITSIFLICLLLYSAFKLRKRQPVYSFGVLWFFSAHALESTFLPLELYFEHRNYMAMIGPIVVVVYYLYHASLLVKKKTMKQALNAFPIVLIILFGAVTYQSTVLWGKPLSLFSIWAYESPKSIRAQVLYARHLEAIGDYTKARDILLKTLQIYPKDITIPLHLVDISCRHNISLQKSINELMSIDEESIYKGSASNPLRSIIEHKLSGKCESLTSFDLHAYMEKLVEISTIRNNKSRKAPILYLHADFYVAQKNLSPAIEILDKVFLLQPTVDIALRQTVLLYSAGLYEDAYIYLEKAIQADTKRKLFTPTRMKELNLIRSSILSRLSN